MIIVSLLIRVIGELDGNSLRGTTHSRWARQPTQLARSIGIMRTQDARAYIVLSP